MRYTKQNNIYIIEVSPKDFKIIMNDSKKKTALPKNYCNAGFFANYDETINGKTHQFTLPVAHLVCDYDATSSSTKKYCTERGKFNGNKFTFDSSTWSYCNAHYNKPISTLLVNNNKAEIKEVTSIPSGYNYAISGIPIVRNGSPVDFETDVQTQGWDSSPLYGTWHIFIGLKRYSDTIYIIGTETKTWNMVKTKEAYDKLKPLGLYDIIKLDGGGSFHMNVDGKTIVGTYENRRVNTVICFDEIDDNTVNNNNNTVANINTNNVNNAVFTNASANTTNNKINKAPNNNKKSKVNLIRNSVLKLRNLCKK